MHFPHFQHRHFKPIARLGIFYLFLSIGLAMVSTIWAVYLNSFLHSSSLVGFLTSFFTIAEVVAFVFLIPFVERADKSKMLLFSLLFFVTSYFLFSVYSNLYLVIVLGTLVAVFTSLRITTFGLIVRDNTEDENVSKNEGFVYALLNSAWFIGPLLAGYVASKMGYESVFLLSSLFILLSVLSFRFFKIKDRRITKKVDRHPLELIAKFFGKKERIITYILTTAIAFWWAFIYIYMPIYIVNRGYGALLLGIFLAGVTVPLVIFEFVFGKLAGKKGFKKLFFTGFASLGIIAVSCFFISNVYVILVLLVLASISVSMLEPTTEAYFLDLVSEDDRDRYYGIYTTSANIGGLLGSLPAAVVLTFVPFNFLFLVFGIPMIILSFFALRIKDSYEFRKAKKH